MSRFHQLLFVISAAGLCWLLMQAVHELGHFLAAWLTGGTVQRIVLHPLAISRTDVEPNPRPLIVAWAGPLAGVLLPLIVWTVARVLKLQAKWLLRFFAGFCLVANGAYLGIGSFQGIGDAGDIQREGSPGWTLWLFGLIAFAAGLALWNSAGSEFGIGRDAEMPSARLAWTCAALLALTIVVELVFAGR